MFYSAISTPSNHISLKFLPFSPTICRSYLYFLEISSRNPSRLNRSGINSTCNDGSTFTHSHKYIRTHKHTYTWIIVVKRSSPCQLYCVVDTNDCLSSPCHFGAACEDQAAGYRCICPPGFAGPDCHKSK